MSGIPAHVCDSGNFDRSICPDPCGAMHSYCDACGKRQDPCTHDDPTPQPAHDHGSAGFCTDRANSKPSPSSAQTWRSERPETVAEAVEANGALTERVVEIIWPLGDPCGEWPREVGIYSVAAAVVAALDDETARLRDEVERVIRAGRAVARGATARIESLTSDLTAARAALDRAWFEGWTAGCNDQQYGDEDAKPWTPNPYRAALDPEEPR